MDAGDIVHMGRCIYKTNRTVLITNSDCEISHPGRPSFVVFTQG